MTGDFVVDCSVALPWYVQDEKNEFTEFVLNLLPAQTPIVPDIFFLEFTNAILSAQRARRITPLQLDAVIDSLFVLPITIDHGCSRGFARDILSLARTHNLSTYDAAYLELAQREQLPLATQDQPLAKAAKAAGVKLLAHP